MCTILSLLSMATLSFTSFLNNQSQEHFQVHKKYEFQPTIILNLSQLCYLTLLHCSNVKLHCLHPNQVNKTMHTGVNWVENHILMSPVEFRHLLLPQPLALKVMSILAMSPSLFWGDTLFLIIGSTSAMYGLII